MRPVAGILFDLDGVLINSEPSYSRFWRHIDEVYPTGVANFADTIKGNTLSTILSTHFDAAVHADITSRLHQFEATAPYPPFDDTFATLKCIKDFGVKTALVTSSDNAKMANLYRQHPAFTSYFDAIVTADNVTRSKPDPQGYIIAAKMLGLSPAECIVVEDSPAGLEAGRRAGAFVCGLATTVGADRVSASCDLLLSSLSDLADAISHTPPFPQTEHVTAK